MNRTRFGDLQNDKNIFALKMMIRKMFSVWLEQTETLNFFCEIDEIRATAAESRVVRVSKIVEDAPNSDVVGD